MPSSQRTAARPEHRREARPHKRASSRRLPHRRYEGFRPREREGTVRGIGCFSPQVPEPGGDRHMALGTATVAYELRFDAGRICLDLLATTHPEERFDSLEVLCAWITG